MPSLQRQKSLILPCIRLVIDAAINASVVPCFWVDLSPLCLRSEDEKLPVPKFLWMILANVTLTYGPS